MNCYSFIFHQETLGGRKLSAVCFNGFKAGLEGACEHLLFMRPSFP